VVYLEQEKQTFDYDHLEALDNMLMKLTAFLVAADQVIYLVIAVEDSQRCYFQPQHLVLEGSQLTVLENLLKTDELEGQMLTLLPDVVFFNNGLHFS
jgi:hypothetical protein